MIVILGASGFIGNHLYNGLKNENFKVAGTYFKNKKQGLVYFDIENTRPEEFNLFQEKIQYLIISAAVNANIDDSKRNWENAYNINVLGINALINFCFSQGIIPVYISTDNVFDGGKGNYKETDIRNPINCYGQIRYEVENHLLNSKNEFIILRLGKVFGKDLEDNTLITTIIRDLKEGRRLSCADDQLFSPIYIGDLVDAIKIIIAKNFKGIFHLASVKATTRLEMTKTICDHFDLNGANIIPCKINSLNLLEKRPLLINLDSSKYSDISGFEPRELGYYLSFI